MKKLMQWLRLISADKDDAQENPAQVKPDYEQIAIDTLRGCGTEIGTELAAEIERGRTRRLQSRLRPDEHATGVLVYQHPEIREILRVILYQFGTGVEVDLREDIGTEIAKVPQGWVPMTPTLSPDHHMRVYEALRFIIANGDWSDRADELAEFTLIKAMYRTAGVGMPIIAMQEPQPKEDT